MTPLAAVELYGRALASDASARRSSLSQLQAQPPTVHSSDGRSWTMPLQRYLGSLTAADEDVLSRATAPVLDVGCGPGRHVLALARRGSLALGVDVSPVAVRIARERGAIVRQASVFDDIPGAGTWGSALLLDGNIGIGGRPTALLARLARLLRPGGVVLAELEAAGAPSGSTRIRLEAGGAVSDWFRWAHVGVDAVHEHAAAADLEVREIWEVQGRWFACLVR
jgi:SAM-dependent methyltransferase